MDPPPLSDPMCAGGPRDGRPCKGGPYAFVPAPTRDDQRQTFSAGLVDAGEEAEPASVVRLRFDPATSPDACFGRRRTHGPSFSHSRPRFGWRWGTFTPARRQTRSTRSWSTDPPAAGSSAVTRRRPCRLANATVSSVGAPSSSAPHGTLRRVDRCWPSTPRTRRPDTSGTPRTWATQRRRRAGPGSFPSPPPAGWACRARGRKVARRRRACPSRGPSSVAPGPPPGRPAPFRHRQ